MATLTIIIWLIVLSLFISEWIGLMSDASDSGELFLPKSTFHSLWIIHGIIVIPISYGIYWDLYGKFPNFEVASELEIFRFALIAGFLALGAFSISSFIIHRKRLAIYFQNKSRSQSYSSLVPNRYSQNIIAKEMVIFTIEIIGFIGSILGIISFYLDYIK